MGILSFINEGFTLKKNIKEWQQEKDGKLLEVDIKACKKPYPTLEGIDGDFIPLEVTFFNDNPFTIIVVEISLIGEGNGQIIMGDYDPSVEVIEVDPPRMFNFDDIIIPPPFAGGGTLKIGIEGETSIIDPIPVLLISRDTLKSNLNQIDMVFTYRTTKNKEKEFKIPVTSQPIK